MLGEESHSPFGRRLEIAVAGSSPTLVPATIRPWSVRSTAMACGDVPAVSLDFGGLTADSEGALSRWRNRSGIPTAGPRARACAGAAARARRRRGRSRSLRLSKRSAIERSRKDHSSERPVVRNLAFAAYRLRNSPQIRPHTSTTLNRSEYPVAPAAAFDLLRSGGRSR